MAVVGCERKELFFIRKINARDFYRCCSRVDDPFRLFPPYLGIFRCVYSA